MTDRWIKVRSTLAYIVFVAVSVVLLAQKKDFHVDEILTYGLSNYKANVMLVEYGFTYEPAAAPYLDYVSVDADERFHYANVWSNQAGDVHPPLYYALVHTVCSLFPETFSIWYAGSINIVFGLVTLYFFRRIVRLLSDDRFALSVATVVFLFSAGITSAVSFLRMYVLAMCFVTMLAFFYLGVVVGVRKTDWKFWLGVLFVGLGGAMTHYYCIVFFALITVVFGIWLIIRRRWKNVLSLIGIWGGVAGLSLLIFPAMVDHVLSSMRGREAVSNLAERSLTDYLDAIRRFFQIADEQIFGGFLMAELAGIFLAAVGCLLLKKKGWRGEKLSGISLLGIAVVVYFILVANMSPYYDGRYLFPVYPLLVVGGVVLPYQIMGAGLTRNILKYGVMIVLTAGMTLGSWEKGGCPYLYLDSVSGLEQAESNKELNAVVYNEAPWQLSIPFQEVLHYHSVTFCGELGGMGLFEYKYSKDRELVCLISAQDRETALRRIMDELPYVDCHEQVNSYYYETTTYRLFSEGENCTIQPYDCAGYLDGEEVEYGFLEAVLAGNPEELYISRDDGTGSRIVLDGKVLDATGGFADGMEVKFYYANGAETQRWKLVKNEDGSYRIEAGNGAFCLAYDTDRGLYLSGRTGGNQEKWRISHLQK